MGYVFPAVLMILPIFMALAALHFAKQRHKAFLNPLTGSLAKPPGARLAYELGAEQLAVGYSLLEITLPVIAPIMLYIQLSENISAGESVWVGLFALVLLLWAASVVYSVWKLARRVERIRSLRLAYECELAVGQELDQLMLDGFRVFHDVQVDDANIDHMVIGQSGVFAVETRGRSKCRDNKRSDGKKRLSVTYEDGVLKFPGEQDGGVPQHAAKLADWAEKWLTDATGFDVPVRPVVVLPGWYIENKDRPEVPVIASGYIQRYFQTQRHLQLNHRDVQQIVQQVDQQERDIASGRFGRPLAKSA